MPRSWLLGFVAKRTVAESYKRLTSPLIRLQRLSSVVFPGLRAAFSLVGIGLAIP